MAAPLPSEAESPVASDDSSPPPSPVASAELPAHAEKLLAEGAFDRAAAAAESALRSSRRPGRPFTPADRKTALSVLIQALHELGRFKDLEALLNEVLGGVQELPASSLLLWAAVGCEAGESERVGSALLLRLKFAMNGKRKVSAENLVAIARMYSLEILAKSGQDPAAAREWIRQWQAQLGMLETEAMLKDLAIIEESMDFVVGHTPEPPSPEIQEVELREDSWLGVGAERLAATAPDTDDPTASADKQQTSWVASAQLVGQNIWTRVKEATPPAIRELETQQLVAGGIAGAALMCAVYSERRSIYRAMRRAGSGARQMLGI